MKKTPLIFLISFLLCSSLFAEEELDSPWDLHAELDMYLGLKIGVDYQLNDRLHLIAGLGANIINPLQFSYSFYTSFPALHEHEKIQVAVNMGILHGVFDVISLPEDRYFYINPGLTLHLSYPVAKRLRIGAQGGMVLMIGYEQDAWGSSLEPFAGITFSFSEK